MLGLLAVLVATAAGAPAVTPTPCVVVEMERSGRDSTAAVANGSQQRQQQPQQQAAARCCQGSGGIECRPSQDSANNSSTLMPLPPIALDRIPSQGPQDGVDAGETAVFGQLLAHLRHRTPEVTLATAFRGNNVRGHVWAPKAKRTRHHHRRRGRGAGATVGSAGAFVAKGSRVTTAPHIPPEPIAGHLRRVVCKLQAGLPIIVVVVGGSNTDGRHPPFYRTELEDFLNAAFPVRRSDHGTDAAAANVTDSEFDAQGRSTPRPTPKPVDAADVNVTATDSERGATDSPTPTPRPKRFDTRLETGQHVVLSVAHGGSNSATWASTAGFQRIKTALTLGGLHGNRTADLMLLETEANDLPRYINMGGPPTTDPIWGDPRGRGNYRRNATTPSERFPHGLNFEPHAQLEAVLHLSRAVVPDLSFGLLGVALGPLVYAHCGHHKEADRAPSITTDVRSVRHTGSDAKGESTVPTPDGSTNVDALLDWAEAGDHNGSTGWAGLALQSLRAQRAAGYLARARCSVLPGSSPEWPLLGGTDCNAELDSLDKGDGRLDGSSGEERPHFCERSRWTRPVEECLGLPAVSLSDALWPVATTPPFAAQLAPKNCDSHPPQPRIFSFDKSHHVGGYGNRIIASLIVTMLTQAAVVLGPANEGGHGLCAPAPLPDPRVLNHKGQRTGLNGQGGRRLGSGGAAAQSPPGLKPPPAVPGHFVSQTELQRIQTTEVPAWREVVAGDGWCQCKSPFPRDCPGRGSWLSWAHAAQGVHKEWCDGVRAKRAVVGHHNLSWTVTLPAHPHGTRVSLEYIKSSFAPYGPFVVSAVPVSPTVLGSSADPASTPTGSNDEGASQRSGASHASTKAKGGAPPRSLLHGSRLGAAADSQPALPPPVLIDGSAPAHTVPARAQVASGLGYGVRAGRDWRFTLTPLPKAVDSGAEDTQIVVVTGSFHAAPDRL